MAGTYSVTVTTGGCTSVAGTTAVVVNPLPATPTASNTGPYCAGSTITLNTPTVTGAAYSWSGPGTFTSATQNPTRPTATTAMAGTYSVTVTTGGCTSLAGTTAVVVNPVPATPTASNTGPYCAGATITLNTPTVTGAAYHWSGPGTFTSTTQNPTRPTATTAMAGTYSVTVTTGGCTSLAGTTAVVVNPLPATPTASNTGPYCTGSTITLNTPTVTGAYSWTGPGTFTSTTQNPTRPTATTAMAGTYSVTVTTGGCTSLAGTTAVIVHAGPTALATTTTSASCGTSNGAITIGAVTGGTGPDTYSVNAGGFTTTTSYPSMAAGTYSVIVKDVNGCTFTTSAVISNSSGPTAIAGTTTNSTCGNANGMITLGTVTGGVAPYTYSIDGSGYTSTISYTGLTAGAHTIIVKDASGCMYTTTLTITNTAGPSAVAVTNTSANCGGTDGTITIGTTTGGTASYIYSVNSSGFTSTVNYSGFAAGTYTVIVKDANGCTFSTTTTVGNTGTTPATPTITQSGSVLTSSSATGNQWYLNGTAITGATGQNYTFTANGTYTVVVTTGGCASATSAPVVITTTGIDEANNPYLFSIYPNPNDGNFTVSFNAAVRSSYKLELYNALGQIIYRDDVTDFSGVYTKKLSVTEYGKGVYTITLTNAKNETVKRIIVY
jgi:Secretion system C-terminal sorting domain/SprB repeat